MEHYPSLVTLIIFIPLIGMIINSVLGRAVW